MAQRKGIDLAVLLVAVALLAATSSVVKWLQVNQPLMVDREAISFCNVLFIGNLLAGLVALFTFQPKRVARDLRAASAVTWVWLVVSAILAVFIPVMIFLALERTSVTNVVLLGRFESVAFALLNVLFLGARLRKQEALGYAVIVIGILGIVLVQSEWRLMRGELLVIAAGLLQAIAAIFSARALAGASLGAFVFFRNAVSAVVFAIVAVGLYGPQHFADAFHGRLWIVMLAYALLIVVLGQVAWYRSLSRLPAAAIANGSLASPAFGILFAWLLLRETPSAIQWTGAGVVLLGMLLVRLGATREPGVATSAPGPDSSLAGV